MPGHSHAPRRAFVRALRRAFVPGVLAALSLCATFALGACDSVDGITPTCEPNVDANGIHPVENGCAQFPPCVIDGEVRPVSECCAGLKDNALEACKWSYGAADPRKGTTSSGTGAGGSGGNGGTGGTGGTGGAGGGN